jgi:hypothetical protein
MSDPAVFVGVLIVLSGIAGLCMCIRMRRFIAEVRDAYEGV